MQFPNLSWSRIVTADFQNSSTTLSTAEAISIGRAFAASQPRIPELWSLDRTTKVVDRGAQVIVSLPIWNKSLFRGGDVYAETIIDKATRTVVQVQEVNAHTGVRGRLLYERV